MIIKYKSHCGFLSENKWKSNIIDYLDKIKSIKIGELLLNKIQDFIEIKKNKVIIKNYSDSKIIQYPHCQRNGKDITIYIPDSPYFISVPVFDEKLIEDSSLFGDLKNLVELNPLDKKLDCSFVKSFSKFEFQPYVVILFHELIHCYRFLTEEESIDDEEAIIYGLKNQTSIINDNNKIHFMTENNFRKSLGLSKRISHDSKFIYVENCRNETNLNHDEKDYYFKKIS